MPYFKAKDGTDIYFNDWGAGMPVVLIHGWPLTSASWEYQATTLAENGFRVITYDRRGFGRSGQPFTGYEYDTLASDLATLIDGLDLKGAAIVGFSMGGGEVARYLATYGSARVSKAVFISAVTPYLLKTNDNPEGVDDDVFTKMIDGLKKDRADFLKSFGEQFYGYSMVHHTVSQAMLEFTHSMAMTSFPKATIQLVNAFAKTDFRNDVLGIRIPTLVVHGTADKTVPIDAAGRRTAAMVPNAQLLEYDGEPHGLNVTAPDKLNADLIDFLRS